MNQNAFHKLSYGVYVVSTWDNGRPTGCTANSAMQITASPATIAVSITTIIQTGVSVRRASLPFPYWQRTRNRPLLEILVFSPAGRRINFQRSNTAWKTICLWYLIPAPILCVK